jgi:hypothetical protein
MPPQSSNPHFFCPCEKRQYLGVDATRLLGFVALNLRRANGYTTNTLPAIYRPNHHVFYANRVVDCTDGLPKWKTVLEGETLPELTSADRPLPRASADDMILSSTSSSNNGGGICNRPTMWLAEAGHGRISKDVLPLSPVRPPEPAVYHFAEAEFPANNHTQISDIKIQERVAHKYLPSQQGAYVPPKGGKGGKRGVIVIGGGHNGLVSAAYLARSGVDVVVLERRHVIGGAAVTEEIVPGFKFSRASYLAGLLRPRIIKELGLERYGFKYLPRNPSSFTPTLKSSPYKGKYLLLGDDEKANYDSIAQFSVKDAEAFPKYEAFLGQVREIMQPLLDNPLPALNPLEEGLSWKDKVSPCSVPTHHF